MKETEIDQAIADACNWSYVGINTRTMFCTGEKYVGNPTADLNAIHEAVRHKLQRHEMSMDDFATNLAKVIKVPSASLALIIATAAQLSEAFLKTLNLWKP